MTKQSTQKVSARRMYALNQRNGPFAEERAHYIEHLLKRGWAPATLCGTASNLNAFADRVDIDSEGGVTLAQMEAAADDWMKQPGHYFRCAIGPHRSRTRFVNVAVNWLRFMGRFREPECAPIPYADLVTEFCAFLEQERELAAASVRLKRIHALNFSRLVCTGKSPVQRGHYTRC